jgi:MFS family permease
MGRLWRHADFLRLWAGETASMFGDHVSSLAIPTIAILLLHAGPFQVGILTALAWLPYPLLALPAGVWVDRLPRRPLMIAADLLRLVTLSSIPAAYLLHHLTLLQLCVSTFATGCCSVFFVAAYRAYLPALVDAEDLVEGNSKLEASHAAAHVVGPGIGGALIQALGAPAAVLADALSFAASAIGLVWIRRREAPKYHHGRDAGFRGELGGGVRLLVRHPVLGRLAVADALNNLGLSVGQAVFLIFAYQVLAQSPGTVGLVLAAEGVAALLGAMAASRLGRGAGMGPALAVSGALIAAGWGVAPLALVAPAVPVLLAAGALQGFFGSVWTITSVSLRQATVAPDLQGRLHAAMAGITYGVIPIGAFLGGSLGTVFGQWLGSAQGLAVTLLIGAGIGLESVLWIAIGPVISLRQAPSRDPS